MRLAASLERPSPGGEGEVQPYSPGMTARTTVRRLPFAGNPDLSFEPRSASQLGARLGTASGEPISFAPSRTRRLSLPYRLKSYYLAAAVGVSLLTVSVGPVKIIGGAFEHAIELLEILRPVAA